MDDNPGMLHICDVCNEAYTRHVHLLSHKKRKHTTINNHKYQCNRCHRPFKTANGLGIHMGHSNKKGVCPKAVEKKKRTQSTGQI